MGLQSEFEEAVGLVVKHANFDVYTNVSVFETNIRVVGGLLSAHSLATEGGLAEVRQGTPRWKNDDPDPRLWW